MIARDDMLVDNLNHTAQHTLGTLVGAMNAAASEDVRGRIFWPVLKAMLDRGRAPSDLAADAVQQLQAWADAGAPRLDLDGDGNLDMPGVAILDAGWPRMANAALCPVLSQKLCDQLATRQSRFDSPNRNHGSQYSGWYHYMAKSRPSWAARCASPTRESTAATAA
jgi:hypothetical protein